MNRIKSYTFASVLTAGLVLGSCASPLTKKLYFTSSRPRAYLPTDKEEQAGRTGMLSEIVTYSQKVDTLKRALKAEAKPKEDGIKTQVIEAVTVTAERPRVKISTLRKGRINLTFLVTVPRAMMDERYQVVLSPRLMTEDTVMALPPVVLKGRDFKVAQDKEQKAFARFNKSIIDSAKYDSAFFDSKAHRRFMGHLQNDYYWAYRRQLSLQLSYERWRRIMEQRYMEYNASRAGAYDTEYHAKALEMLRAAYRDELSGLDSVGQRKGFDMLYPASRRAAYLKRWERRIDSTNIPNKYRMLFERDWTIDSMENKSLTEKDSLEVATHTYNFRAIAHNESRRTNAGLYRRHIVHFPLIEDPQHEGNVTPGKDFVYLYSRDLEVTPQMKKRMKIVVDSRITAIDQSTWMQRGTDTLAFVISGLNDLVDATLIDRLNEKPDAAAEYKLGLERMAARDYRGALEYLRKYPDYNGALALAGMDENERALQVLNQLGANGKVEYLKAICLTRLSRHAEARAALLRAVKKQSYLVYKAETEASLAPLMQDAAFVRELKSSAEELDE
jgi:hypothetical protein